MKSLAFFVVVLASALLQLEAQHFGYSLEEQEKWSDEYPECGENLQSPIEIFAHTAEPAFMFRLKLLDYYERIPLILRNNGQSAEATIDLDQTDGYFKMPRISGGPLSDTYEFQSLHFHWSEHDDRGAEHIIDGYDYPLELHLVHKNTRYDTLNEALQYSDGLTVLGILFHLSDSDGIEIADITDSLTYIQQYNATTEVYPTRSLRYFVGKLNTRKFYTYEGSLTSPPCSQAVTWIVFRKTLPVSNDQLNQFRSLFDVYGNPLLSNYRFVQPLNGRTVYRRTA